MSTPVDVVVGDGGERLRWAPRLVLQVSAEMSIPVDVVVGVGVQRWVSPWSMRSGGYAVHVSPS